MVMWSKNGEMGAETQNIFMYRGDIRKLLKREWELEKHQANHGRRGFPAVGEPGWKRPGGPQREDETEKTLGSDSWGPGGWEEQCSWGPKAAGGGRDEQGGAMGAWRLASGEVWL